MRNHLSAMLWRPSIAARRRRLVVETLESRYVLAANLASIAGLVFDDATGDGLTPGEQLAGVVVELYHDDGDGLFQHDGRDTYRASDTTDSSGHYRFDGLTAGTYHLRQPAQQTPIGPLAELIAAPVTVTSLAAQGTAGLSIDSFDVTAQSVTVSGSGTALTADGSAVAAPETLGGHRDLFVGLTSPAGRLELSANETTPGLLEFGSLGTTTGTRLVTWDGPDGNAAQLDATGLGGIDLTDGDRSVALQLAIGADHDGGVATIRVYTDASHWSRAVLAIPNTGGGADARLLVSFADDFVPMGTSGSADFTRVGAVQFELDGGQAIDGQLDQLTTLGPTVLQHDFANRQLADLSLTKTVDRASPTIGETVTFTVRVTNDGPSTATHVTVRDWLPARVEFASAGADRGSYDSIAGIWDVGTVAAGDSHTLQIRATVISAGVATNAAEVLTSDQLDIDSTPGNGVAAEDDQDTASLRSQAADLSLTKTVNQPSPQLGDDVTFTLLLHNDGPDRATGITVHDVLPPGLALVADTPAQGAYNAGTGRWTVASLDPGASARLDLRATVMTIGIKTNTAQITAADQFDSDSTPGNNLAGEDDQDIAAVTPQVVDLALTKTVDVSSPSLGDRVEFTITVRNAGPNTATGVTVRDLLPAGLSFVAASEDQGDYDAATGLWVVGTLPAGGQRSLDIVTTLTSSGTKTNVTEIVAVDQYDIDSTPGNGISAEDDQDQVALVPLGRLAGYVYLDADNDGVRDSGEAGIGGVAVTLTGTDRAGATVFRTATTSADGAYSFDGLAASDAAGYQIAETQPAGVLDGRDTVGSLGAAASADSSADTFQGIVLAAGAEGIDYAFGEIESATISGFVYVDANNDGIKQPDERGIGGAVITLTGTDDRGRSVLKTTETDDQGQYAFLNLRPSGDGFYRLEEGQPEGYRDGKDTPGVPASLSLFSAAAVDEVFSQIALPAGVEGHDFNFGELLTTSFTKRRFLASSR